MWKTSTSDSLEHAERNLTAKKWENTRGLQAQRGTHLDDPSAPAALTARRVSPLHSPPPLPLRLQRYQARLVLEEERQCSTLADRQFPGVTRARLPRRLAVNVVLPSRKSTPPPLHGKRSIYIPNRQFEKSSYL